MSAGSGTIGAAGKQGISQLTRSCGSIRQGPAVSRRIIAQPSRTSSSRSFASSSKRLEEVPQSHLGPLAAKDASLYDTLRPQPQSVFVALAHRLNLISPKTEEYTKRKRVESLIQACTHPSFAQLITKTKEKYGQDGEVGRGKGVVRNDTERNESTQEDRTRKQLDNQYFDPTIIDSNESLAALGNTTLGLVASEYLHLRYPNLPNRVFKASLSAYVGPNTLADVATELGIAAKGVVRWNRSPPKSPVGRYAANDLSLVGQILSKKTIIQNKLLSRDVHAEAMRSIIAIILQHQGLSAARTFVHTHLLSRSIDMLSLLKFNEPKRTLTELCRKLDKERPQSRLIAETGRLSINPVFVVGVYSGLEKLGEGTGSAIRMAEYRAAEDALRRFYLSERPMGEISLPSMTLDTEVGSKLPEEPLAVRRSIWEIDAVPSGVQNRPPALAFQASKIGHSEVVFGSKG